jgi:glycosyltransferase involved in cell wall biosynthesis
MSAPVRRAYDGAAVVIPAHNERAKLPACLRAVLTASLCAPIPVVIVVVLDASDDGSAALAGQYGTDVHFVRVDARNVGAARAVGFGYARSLFGDGSGDTE